MIVFLHTIGLGAAAYVVWQLSIGVRVSRYRRNVSEMLVAQLGTLALDYMDSQLIIDQVATAYRQGYSASTTAEVLARLILQIELEAAERVRRGSERQGTDLRQSQAI